MYTIYFIIIYVRTHYVLYANNLLTRPLPNGTVLLSVTSGVQYIRVLALTITIADL